MIKPTPYYIIRNPKNKTFLSSSEPKFCKKIKDAYVVVSEQAAIYLAKLAEIQPLEIWRNYGVEDQQLVDTIFLVKKEKVQVEEKQEKPIKIKRKK